MLVVDSPSDKYFFLSASEFRIFADGILAPKVRYVKTKKYFTRVRFKEAV